MLWRPIFQKLPYSFLQTACRQQPTEADGATAEKLNYNSAKFKILFFKP
jgi:hypothetical protein